MSPKLGKHTPYFELVEAQAQAGCPICRLAYKATDRYIDSLLYEAVLDPDVRAKLKSAQGFCAEHVEMLRNHPGRALGIALIYRDIIRALAESAQAQAAPSPPWWRRLLRPLRGKWVPPKPLAAGRGCPACEVAARAEGDYIGLLLAHLEDERLSAAYAAGEGLCLAHFQQAVAATEDETTLRRLVAPQVARYRRMLADLDEFIRKRDHRFREEKYGEEGDVWLRAMNAIVGGAGQGLSARAGGRRIPLAPVEEQNGYGAGCP